MWVPFTEVVFDQGFMEQIDLDKATFLVAKIVFSSNSFVNAPSSSLIEKSSL